MDQEAISRMLSLLSTDDLSKSTQNRYLESLGLFQKPVRFENISVAEHNFFVALGYREAFQTEYGIIYKSPSASHPTVMKTKVSWGDTTLSSRWYWTTNPPNEFYSRPEALLLEWLSRQQSPAAWIRRIALEHLSR